jgi:hypothetical protein
MAKSTKKIQATVRPAERPPSHEQLGELVEKLLQLLAEERAEREKPDDAPKGNAA